MEDRLSGRVWFIPGTSKGSRLLLAKTLLNEGHKVAVTTDNLEFLVNYVGKYPQEQWLPIAIKAKDPKSNQQAVLDTISFFGQIDVFVNNPRLWKNLR